MNKTKLIIVGLVTALILSGCGDSTKSNIDENYVVKVSRGPVYGAEVKDSADPANIAVEIEGTNTYRFAVSEDEIVLPVTANGGFIDVNNDGKIEAGVDMKLNMELRSYTENLTPITTYLATEANNTIRDAKLDSLTKLVNNSIDDINVSDTDLLKATEDASTEAQLVINAVYSKIIEAQNSNSSLELDTDSAQADLIGKLTDLSNRLNTFDDNLTDAEIAVELEKQTMTELDIDPILEADLNLTTELNITDISS